MECRQVTEVLIEVLEGTAADDLRAAVEQHLAVCDACRDELELVRRGRDSLVTALEHVAPRREYLTGARLDRIMGALGPRVETVRLFSLPHLVAAACAAAIVISCVIIYRHASGIVRGPAAPAALPPVAVIPRQVPTIPVALMSRPEDQGLRVVTGHMTMAAWRSGEQSADRSRPVSMLRTSSPGVLVPARHAFYDAEEDGNWW